MQRLAISGNMLTLLASSLFRKGGFLVQFLGVASKFPFFSKNKLVYL